MKCFILKSFNIFIFTLMGILFIGCSDSGGGNTSAPVEIKTAETNTTDTAPVEIITAETNTTDTAPVEIITPIKTTVSKSIDYDNYARVTKEDLGNGSYIEYTYDNSGNLLSQKIVQGGE